MLKENYLQIRRGAFLPGYIFPVAVLAQLRMDC